MDALASRVTSLPAGTALLDALRGLPAGADIDGLAKAVLAVLASATAPGECVEECEWGVSCLGWVVVERLGVGRRGSGGRINSSRHARCVF